MNYLYMSEFGDASTITIVDDGIIQAVDHGLASVFRFHEGEIQELYPDGTWKKLPELAREDIQDDE